MAVSVITFEINSDCQFTVPSNGCQVPYIRTYSVQYVSMYVTYGVPIRTSYGTFVRGRSCCRNQHDHHMIGWEKGLIFQYTCPLV